MGSSIVETMIISMQLVCDHSCCLYVGITAMPSLWLASLNQAGMHALLVTNNKPTSCMISSVSLGHSPRASTCSWLSPLTHPTSSCVMPWCCSSRLVSFLRRATAADNPVLGPAAEMCMDSRYARLARAARLLSGTMLALQLKCTRLRSRVMRLQVVGGAYNSSRLSDCALTNGWQQYDGD